MSSVRCPAPEATAIIRSHDVVSQHGVLYLGDTRWSTSHIAVTCRRGSVQVCRSSPTSDRLELDSSVYTDPARFEQERRKVLNRSWQIICRSERSSEYRRPRRLGGTGRDDRHQSASRRRGERLPQRLPASRRPHRPRVGQGSSSIHLPLAQLELRPRGHRRRRTGPRGLRREGRSTACARRRSSARSGAVGSGPCWPVPASPPPLRGLDRPGDQRQISVSTAWRTWSCTTSWCGSSRPTGRSSSTASTRTITRPTCTRSRRRTSRTAGSARTSFSAGTG